MKNGHNISFSNLPGKFLPVSDINDLPESQFVQPAAGVLVVDCSTGCLRMISEIPPLVRFLSSHHEFSVTFCLHLKSRYEWQRSSQSTQQSPESKRYTAISIKVIPEQSGKVEYERERLLGIANKLMNLVTYSTFPLCSGDNIN